MVMKPDPSAMPSGLDDDQTYEATKAVNAGRRPTAMLAPADYQQGVKLGENTHPVPGVTPPMFNKSIAQQPQTPGMNGQGMGAGSNGVESVSSTPNVQAYGARGLPPGYK